MDQFCYLEEMLSCETGTEAEMRIRIAAEWRKWRDTKFVDQKKDTVKDADVPMHWYRYQWYQPNLRVSVMNLHQVICCQCYIVKKNFFFFNKTP